MLIGPDVVCCFVAEDEAGNLAGFQTLMRSENLPRDVADIGTFARVGSVQRGTGSRLFAATRAEAARQGLASINATVRADNGGGLAFHERMRFVDHDVRRAVPLRDGTRVDRIEKRHALRPEDEVRP